MKKRGKIKFSHKKGNRGTKTQYFRVCAESLDPQGDWKNHPGFPEPLYEMKFHFPFKKMENNLIIGYSGYTKLPVSAQPGAPLGSYFVLADGIGEPLVAFPDGHNGQEWDGRTDERFVLTEERLAKMQMVKKRLTMILSPEGWGPHEYVTWSTTSEVAIDYAISDYIALVEMIGDDLALFPLTFRAMDKTLKRRDGQTAKFTIGTIGFSGSMTEFAAAVEETKALKEIIDLDKFEVSFESEGIFYKSEEGDEAEEEPAEYDEQTGELIKPAGPSAKETEGITLDGLVSNVQKEKILRLAKRFKRMEEVGNVKSSADALRLLNQLTTQEARAA